MANSREYSKDYLLEMYSAMRWLKEQGLSCEQIREMRWGIVDETDRNIHFPSPVTSIKMNLTTREYEENTEIKDVLIPIKGSGHEWFFLKSKYKCPWMFTKQNPKSWRKEKSREELFSLEEIEELTKSVIPPVLPLLLDEIKALTESFDFGNIRVSIENITKTEAKEQTRKMARV